MKIVIETIPHEKQRYDTVGDYWMDKDGTMQVRISEEDTEKGIFLTMIHELVEAFLTKYQGVNWNDIEEFDKKLLITKPDAEPGDDKNAPYYKQHHLATAIEMILAHELGINWENYNNYEKD